MTRKKDPNREKPKNKKRSVERGIGKPKDPLTVKPPRKWKKPLVDRNGNLKTAEHAEARRLAKIFLGTNVSKLKKPKNLR
jgi:hypothetical protein